ncbi:hypothetical protein [Companilactobacillus zhachilii]|uniref:hypothetical protein n=1 Tax=Companilactobacillus zhachilii TaxID=2304606 RepID=UPI00403484BA
MNEYDIFKIFNSSTDIQDYMNGIRGNKIDLPQIYVGTPQESFIQNSNAPWIRITPIPGDEALYADDERVIEYPRFQIDFWILRYKTKELIKLEQMIYNNMFENGYERYYKNHTRDVDMTDLQMIQGNYEYQL